MKSLGYAVSVLAMIALSFWVYQQNYATRDAIAEANKVSRQINAARARLEILEDEWAYLNRPTRLRMLVEANYARLSLNPMLPDGFGAVEEVPFPVVAPPAPVVTAQSDEAASQWRAAALDAPATEEPL